MNNGLSILTRRVQLIAMGGAARLLAALSTVTISILIVRTQSSALWGEMVPIMLILEFGFSIIGWGALPFLVQTFSLHPNRIKSEWSRSTFSRSSLLLCFLIVLTILSLPFELKIYLIIWAISRYLYQSFEPIAQVERNFVFSIMMEASAIAIMAIPLLLTRHELKIDTIILLFSASMAWRAAASAIFFRKWISYSPPSKTYFKEAFPFFLLTLSGMLQQRTDLYCVAYFLSDQDIAIYQVYFNFLIFCQFLSSLMLSPFAKNIFRLPRASLRKLEIRFALAGIPLTLLSMAAVYMMIRYFYHFDLSITMYVLGYFYILMFYLYLLRNYEMGKSYRQTTVALYGFLGSAVNLSLCVLLIPRFGMEGALWAGSIAQVFIVMLYHRPNASENANR